MKLHQYFPNPENYSKKQIAIRLFLTCWLVYAIHFATNTVREIYPALSLGDHMSFDVSEYLGLHPDIFELPGRGVFINNNPGASILGAIPYTLSRPVIDFIVTRVEQQRAASGAQAPTYDSIYPMAQEFYRRAYERGLDVKFGLGAAVMQAFLMAPVSAFSVVMMFYVLVSLTHSKKRALLLALLFAFATPVFYRTAQLNHNLLETHFAFFAFILLWWPFEKPAWNEKYRYFMAGLLSGYAVVLDYSGLIVVLAIGLYALMRWVKEPQRKRSWGTLLLFGAGVGLNAAFLMAYQWSAFGHPLYPPQQYMPATILSGEGYRGIDWPKLDLLWLTAFGARYGLFVFAPLLVLALFLPAWARRENRFTDELETVFIVLYTLAFFFFTAANQFARLQFNSGIRHVVPVTPFLFLLAASVLVRMPARWAVVTGVVTTYWSWCLTMYRDVEQGFGVFESLIHITLQGPRLPWLGTLKNLGFVPTWFSAVPILVISGILIWVLWTIPGIFLCHRANHPSYSRSEFNPKNN